MRERSNTESERLTEEEALTLAQMMWNKMNRHPVSGLLSTDIPQNEADEATLQFYGVPEAGFDRRATSEDYQRAFVAIEELERAAKEESSLEKFKNRFVRALLALSYETQKQLKFILMLDSEGAAELRKKYLEKRQNWTDPHQELKDLKRTPKV